MKKIFPIIFFVVFFIQEVFAGSAQIGFGNPVRNENILKIPIQGSFDVDIIAISLDVTGPLEKIEFLNPKLSSWTKDLTFGYYSLGNGQRIGLISFEGFPAGSGDLLTLEIKILDESFTLNDLILKAIVLDTSIPAQQVPVTYITQKENTPPSGGSTSSSSSSSSSSSGGSLLPQKKVEEQQPILENTNEQQESLSLEEKPVVNTQQTEEEKVTEQPQTFFQRLLNFITGSTIGPIKTGIGIIIVLIIIVGGLFLYLSMRKRYTLRKSSR